MPTLFLHLLCVKTGSHFGTIFETIMIELNGRNGKRPILLSRPKKAEFNLDLIADLITSKEEVEITGTPYIEKYKLLDKTYHDWRQLEGWLIICKNAQEMNE